MRKKLIPAILEQVARCGPFDTLLFTGHSAGGALAQLFYALSLTDSDPMAVLAQQFANVHCVTFGTPPFVKPALCPAPTSIFLSIVNDGDLVELAQTEYIKVLIDVIVFRIEDIRKKWGAEGTDQMSIGEPFYEFSGSCIILRDEDPDAKEPDAAYEAFAVTSTELSQLLYGNVVIHHIDEYLNRLNFVLEKVAQHNED